jgi:hypothetical protein
LLSVISPSLSDFLIGGKRLLDDPVRADRLLSGRLVIVEPPQDLLPTASVTRLGRRLEATTATQPRWQHGWEAI